MALAESILLMPHVYSANRATPQIFTLFIQGTHGKCFYRCRVKIIHSENRLRQKAKADIYLFYHLQKS